MSVYAQSEYADQQAGGDHHSWSDDQGRVKIAPTSAGSRLDEPTAMRTQPSTGGRAVPAAPAAPAATVASAALLLLSLVLPWFHQAPLGNAVSGFAAGHLKALGILACAVVPVIPIALGLLGRSGSKGFSRWTVTTSAGLLAVLLTTWLAVSPPPMLADAGPLNGIAEVVVGTGATQAAGIYVALVASMGLAIAGMFLSGAPLAAATANSPAGRLRVAIERARRADDNAVLASLSLALASTAFSLVGLIAAHASIVLLGISGTVIAAVLARGVRKRAKAAEGEHADLARAANLVVWLPLALTAVVIVISALSVGHTLQAFGL